MDGVLGGDAASISNRRIYLFQSEQVGYVKKVLRVYVPHWEFNRTTITAKMGPFSIPDLGSPKSGNLYVLVMTVCT
jgi:hypothetical protein